MDVAPLIPALGEKHFFLADVKVLKNTLSITQSLWHRESKGMRRGFQDSFVV